LIVSRLIITKMVLFVRLLKQWSRSGRVVSGLAFNYQNSSSNRPDILAIVNWSRKIFVLSDEAMVFMRA